MFAREESYSKIQPDPSIFEGAPRRRLDPRRVAEMLSGEPSAEPDSSVGRREFEPPPVARRSSERATDLSCGETVEIEESIDALAGALRPRGPPAVVLSSTDDSRDERLRAARILTTGAVRRPPSLAADVSALPSVGSEKFQILGSVTIPKPDGARARSDLFGFGAALGKQTNPDQANGRFRAIAFARAQASRPPGSTACLAKTAIASKIEDVAEGSRTGRVLSEALPGRKISLQSAGKPIKYGRGSTSIPETAPVSNVVYGNRSQSATPVKIIQQQTFPPGRGGCFGAVPFGANAKAAYVSANSASDKNWSQSCSNANVKAARPFAKNVINVQKLSKMPSQKATHLSNAISTFITHDTQNYHAIDYPGTENNNLSYSQSNKDITAQILKHLVPSGQQISASTKRPPVPYRRNSFEANVPKKFAEQKHQTQSDQNMMSNNEGVGIEDRSSESYSFHYRNLQSVMLDHTYAVSTQTVSNPTVNGTGAPVAGEPSPPSPPREVVPSPVSPIKTAVLRSVSPGDGAISVQSSAPAPRYDERVVAPLPVGYQYDVSRNEEDDAASAASSADDENDATDGRHDSDTETAPEGEEEGKTRCVCEFTHDDGYMICCDRCGEWQHVDCMGIDRQNIPDDYMCDRCQPRSIDRKRARSIQIRKREELTGVGSSGSDSSSGASAVDRGNKQTIVGIGTSSSRKRPLTVTTYSNTVGGVSRTVPSSGFSPPYVANSVPPQTKRGLKRPRKVDNGRKGPKRRIPEKRKRKSGELSSYRSKFCSSNRTNQWAETYESAMTNHYSPELRAKIARYCSNRGVGHGDSGAVLTVHSCTTVPHAGGKILIATADMKENTPVIELRGKYMLSTQHKPSPQTAGRIGSQRPGPFLFFYRLPKDSTQICIDTRTYGNEARFVRRSCKPNAELRHCIVKGALHVYLVTVAPVQSNTEISIRHETAGGSQLCACGNPKHCKQNSPASPVLHKNNGAAADGVDERRGRTRLASSSSAANSVGIVAKYEDVKLEDRDADVKSSIESDLEAIKNEICESKLYDKIDANAANEVESVRRPSPVKQEPKEEAKMVDIKLEEDLSEDEPLKPKVKDENSIDSDVPLKDSVAEPISAEVKEEESNVNSAESKSILHSVTKSKSSSTVKEKDEKQKKSINSRRSSAQPARTTRASSAICTNESADEKSDTQSDSKGSQMPKDKKKMTREERKMEAIMKAFERMEKAELRKQENKDRQTRRRESDPQQPNCDSKDQQNDEDDSMDHSSVKRRRRKKGRTRSTSNHQSSKNRNRLNSVDSDMITSGEESTSLLSPPLPQRACSVENYSDPRIDSAETASFHDDVDTIRLQRSVTRLNMGLSSACMLVEAAVGPLESTFKFPKTKKDMMNEWLSKSPEQSGPYDMNHALDYSNASDNNNTSTLVGKSLYAGEKFENLMKAANTMIGNFSGGTISADSTPEKNYSREESFESDKLSPAYGLADSPLRSPAELSLVVKNKKVDLDINKDEKKIPKRYRKGFKSVVEEFTNKRALRSNAAIENTYYADPALEGNITPPPDGSFAIPSEVQEITAVPKPLQHSAKKRWLRQAISEESDSPTAESPPNEMVTPLKKRRLARESLSLERPFVSNDESNLTPTPTTNPETPPQFTKSINEDGLNCQTIMKIDEIETEKGAPCSSVGREECETATEETIDTSMEKEVSNEEISQIIIGGKDTTGVIEKSDSNIETLGVLNDNSCKISDADNSVSNNLELSINNPSHDEDVDSSAVLKDNAQCEDVSNFEKSPCKSESASNVNSTETSGNSSPVLDDIDDIKKKIHTFHTENIQILKIRNKKQPKEKRKKVNLNFDLCVLADQTVGVKLKSENKVVEDDGDVKLKDVEGKSPVTSLNADAIHSDSSNLSESNSTVGSSQSELSKKNETISKGFMCTPLFTGESNSSSAQMPDLNVIKNAIDMTTSLEINIKSGNLLNKIDEYKNVQEILSRVKQMDSHNSVLLSGVLRDSNHSLNVDNTFSPNSKTNTWRVNDPRLNPPPVDKPKPVRRKLSITEYRRRHSMLSNNSGDQDAVPDSACSATQPSSSVSSNLSDSINLSIASEKSSDICRISESSIIESINKSVSGKDEYLDVNFTCLTDKPSPPPEQFEKPIQGDGDPVRTPSPSASVTSDDVSSQIKVTR